MAAPQSPAKKAKAKKAAKPWTHLSCFDMVHVAVSALKDRKESSLAAHKKYIAANYKCDIEKLNVHIKNAVKSGVAKGTLTQVKGKGASGSFKLGTNGDPEKANAKKAKSAACKKAAAEKKKARRQAAKDKKAAKVKAKKDTAKAKKATKKSKKPKKAAAPKKKAAAPKMKAAPKKKATKSKKAAPQKKTAKPEKKAAPKKK